MFRPYAESAERSAVAAAVVEWNIQTKVGGQELELEFQITRTDERKVEVETTGGLSFPVGPKKKGFVPPVDPFIVDPSIAKSKPSGVKR